MASASRRCGAPTLLLARKPLSSALEWIPWFRARRPVPCNAPRQGLALVSPTRSHPLLEWPTLPASQSSLPLGNTRVPGELSSRRNQRLLPDDLLVPTTFLPP